MAWTKAYWCPRGTAASRSAVIAKLVGPEIVVAPTDWYAAAPHDAWAPGKRTAEGYNTKLTFPNPATAKPGVVVDAGITIAWRTSDNQCVLYDLRWENNDTVGQVQVGGVPGGGMAFYDEGTQKLTVAIINDHQSRGRIDLNDVSCALCSPALHLPRRHTDWMVIWGGAPAPPPGAPTVYPLLELSARTMPALDPAPAGPIPSLGYRQVAWGTPVLDPGEFVAFSLLSIAPDAGFVMGRTVPPGAGLQWWEQNLWWAEQITPRAD
jgi:hypothetical protein